MPTGILAVWEDVVDPVRWVALCPGCCTLPYCLDSWTRVSLGVRLTWLARASRSVRGGITLGREQGEPGAEFTALGAEKAVKYALGSPAPSSTLTLA
jgi:hypothetical protein